MNCKEVQAMMVDYLDQAMDVIYRDAIEQHLSSCESCRQEAEELRELVLAMAANELKQPRQELRENFSVMLQSEVNMLATGQLLRDTRGGTDQKETDREVKERDGDLRDGKVGAKLRLLHPAALPWMAAAACILLFGGIWIGAMVGSRKASTVPDQLGAMQKEIKEMKEAMMFSLIDDESASQRIKAVSYAEEMSNPNQRVIQALVNTLNHDKNVNVRLAALYSLGTFADNRSVRDSLVSSLPIQTEPLIQVMLITLLAERKDNRAIAPIRDIISNKNTLPAVKDAAQKSLKTM